MCAVKLYFVSGHVFSPSDQQECPDCEAIQDRRLNRRGNDRFQNPDGRGTHQGITRQRGRGRGRGGRITGTGKKRPDDQKYLFILFVQVIRCVM